VGGQDIGAALFGDVKVANRRLTLPAVVGFCAMVLSALPLSAELVAVRKVEPLKAGGVTLSANTLVNADEEFIAWLTNAEQFVKDKQYDRAIRILQEIILRADSGFLPSPGGHRFVSVHLKANEILGAMGPEGLKLYRRLYDSQAKQLLTQATRKNKTSLLRRIICQYLHTSYGPLALERLGAAHFDQGRFSQAATCWRQAIAISASRAKSEGPGISEAMLLGKVAVACHLGGLEGAAKKAAGELKTRYPQAVGQLGGRKLKLVDFVSAAMKIPPIESVSVREFAKGWPGVGALPGGLGVMSDCEVVLIPRWRYPHTSATTPQGAVPNLIAMSKAMSSLRGKRGTMGLRLRAGHVEIGARSGQFISSLIAPAAIQPVVDGDKVVFRTDQAIIALDMVTGKEIGRSHEGYVMFRPNKPGCTYYGSSQQLGSWKQADDGPYQLTLGGGKVFTVGAFRPGYTQRYTGGWGAAPRGKQDSDTSRLGALSLSAGLKELWSVGHGNGEGDVVSKGRFLTAPAYSDGRLYAVAMYLESFHLVCLDAADGSLIWTAMVSQMPATPRRYNASRYGDVYSRASIPVVAEGKVFVLTNAGVLSAFDAETGQAVWAYQYDSSLNVIQVSRYSRTPPQTMYPPNPILVLDGKVVCLPADTDRVISVSADGGEDLWWVSREDQAFLTAIDEGRFLLSGAGIMVLSAKDGKPISAPLRYYAGPYAPQGVFSRPAVTSSAVLASGIENGMGSIFRMDLKTYQLSKVRLVDADGLLGNLVSVGGKLVAANAAGVCGYFGYDVARANMTERIGQSAPQDKPALILQRGRMAYKSRRYKDALADGLEASMLNREYGDAALQEKLKHYLYRTYVSLGNSAEDPREMLAMFQKASQTAATPLNRRTMMVRLVKCHEKLGGLKAAAALAREIAIKHGKEEFPNVEIGSAADDSMLLDPQATYYVGTYMGFEILLKGMIERHGRGFYAVYDAEAKAALQAAQKAADTDAMIAVAQKWPNSLCATQARFATAELFYRKAKKLSSQKVDKARELFNQALGQLFQAAEQNDNKALHLSAQAAIAVICANMGQSISAGIEAGKALDYQKQHALAAPIAFADLRGPLEKVLGGIRVTVHNTGAMQFVSKIRPPLAQAFAVEGKDAFILCDQLYRPVRIGQSLLVLKGSEVMLLDSSAGSLDKAIQWKGPTEINASRLLADNYMSPPGNRLIAAVSKDRKTVMVADRIQIYGFDIRTGKATWVRRMSDLSNQTIARMAAGDGVMVVSDSAGKVVCIDISSGKTLWTAQLVGPSRSPTSSPQIASGLVMAKSNSGKRLACFSLADKGRVVGEWTAKNYIQGRITPEGLIVLMKDGELSVRELGKAEVVLWKQQYGASDIPAILDISSRKIAVSHGIRNSQIDVLSLLGASGKERILNKLMLTPMGQISMAAMAASFRGEELYVTCGSARRTHVNNTGISRLHAHTIYSYGVWLQKFALSGESRTPAWSVAIDPRENYAYIIMPVTVGQKHVVVTAKSTLTHVPMYSYILDAVKGTVVQKITLRQNPADRAGRNRQYVLGPAVMTNGRLCVETYNGLAIFGGQ